MKQDGKSYWRSLEQLTDDPSARKFLEREFPENATEAPEGITRRTMLSLLGASVSLAGLAACRRPAEKIVPYVNAPEDVIPGVPRYYATTMAQGHNAHGLVVESHEGRPTKIEGNELHPVTRGASNAVLQASILGLYDPDRSASVMQGEQKSSWDAFVAAWSEIEKPFLENGGAGLAVLTEPFSSPTLARLGAAFRARFPRARWVAWEPVSDENIYRGVEAAGGSTLQPLHHFERAKVILSLESDFLLTESNSVRDARGFADARRITSTSDSMSRLLVVESGLSLTGGNADHRLRLHSSMVGVLLARLATKLGLGSSAALDPQTEHWIDVLSRDLDQARGESLIVAGRRQPPEVHAAVLALNSALGNVGRTLTLHEMKDAAPSRLADLQSLTASMREGRVECLIVLGGNPAYNAPADLDFAGAAAGVEQRVHLGMERDETAEIAGWHLPQAHFLESWGDARAIGGTASVIQPLIAPLFGGVSAVEVLGLLIGAEPRTGHELVRETWQGMLDTSDFAKRWNRVLHDGLLPGSGATPVAVDVGSEAIDALARSVQGVSPAGASDLEVTFHPSPSVLDGRWANNGWLQELPDPVTKMTWDNAALLSPATAAELGLENQDVATLRLDGRELDAAVWIVPGQADHSVALVLGYGRRIAGRVAIDRGVNTFALRASSAQDFARGLSVTAAGRRYALSQTQDHGSMEGRPIVRETTLENFREHPTFAQEMVEHPPLEQLWASPQSYDDGYQWGMTIDLNACTGCNACVTACQSENNIPVVGKEQVGEGREMHWIRIDRYFNGELSDPQTVFQPVPCMHCENAPCEGVCPVAATVHDEEGLNVMVYNRCIGTRYCANNCPYKVRRFNFFNFTKDTPEVQKMVHNPDVTVRSRGVMEKCTYCTQRISAARIGAKLDGREIRDGDVTTACEQACPTRAITFGNIRDPESRVSRHKAQVRDYVMLPELNNRPRTSYLAKLRNPHPALAAPAETEKDHG